MVRRITQQIKLSMKKEGHFTEQITSYSFIFYEESIPLLLL